MGLSYFTLNNSTIAHHATKHKSHTRRKAVFAADAIAQNAKLVFICIIILVLFFCVPSAYTIATWCGRRRRRRRRRSRNMGFRSIF
jgi:hypothetical protein